MQDIFDFHEAPLPATLPYAGLPPRWPVIPGASWRRRSGLDAALWSMIAGVNVTTALMLADPFFAVALSLGFVGLPAAPIRAKA